MLCCLQQELRKEKQSTMKKPNAEDKISSQSDFSEMIGGSGWWQIKILWWTMLPSIPTAWNHLGMSFLAYPVDHWCARPKSNNISLDLWWTDFVPNVTLKGRNHHSQCEMYQFNTTTDLPEKNLLIACESYEYATDFNSVINEWDVVCDSDWMLSTSQTIYMIGFLISVLLSGQLSDIYGRKPAMMTSVVILIVAGFAAAYSTSFMMFAIFRFFVAIGHGAVGLVTYIILIEAVGPEYRAKYMIAHSLGWLIGYLILPLITWCHPDWFLIQIIITVPSTIFLLYYWLIPESPRWLLACGNIKKALPILEDAAKTNGKDIKDLEKQAEEFIYRNNKCMDNNTKTTFLDLLRTPNLRTKTLCLYFIWVVIAFTYYGLSLNTNDLQGNAFINFFLAGLMEFPATIFCLLTLDRFGRKKPFFLTLLIGGMACFGCIFVPIRFPGVKTALAMIGKLFNSASFTIVYIFSAEIFPTVARNVGVGSSSTVARIGSSIAPFMKDLSNVTTPSIPFVLFGTLSIISSLIVLKMPETNNLPIPESIDQAENFGKNADKDIKNSIL